MTLFGALTNEAVTSYSYIEQPVRGKGGMSELNVSSDSGRAVKLEDQFIVFQLSGETEGLTIIETSQVEPTLEGSEERPDVLSVLEMLSFHIGHNDYIEHNTCATLRVNFGKDESSNNKSIDTVFWAIASGLRLYDKWNNKPSETKDLKVDFHRAFGNRPIEIPGGLGRISFEVVKHMEEKWWRKLLGFGASETSKRLISVLGFPAVTTQAIGVIDELLERLTESEPEILFQSAPMRLALSKWARDEFTGGNKRIRMGVLNQGFFLLARGRDYGTIANANAVYYPQYGVLVPTDVGIDNPFTVQYEDPFKDITYAVFRIGMKDTKLDPTFNFSL